VPPKRARCRDLHDRAQHQQAVDDPLAQVGVLDRDEDEAPDGERLDEREGGQPDERRRQGEACGPAALEPDGEAEREEDETLREQDDGLVLYEELARGSTAPMKPTRTERVGMRPENPTRRDVRRKIDPTKCRL